MPKLSIEQDWGSFALVSYIPERIATLIQQLRRSLGADSQPQPHITVLPPRPLRVEASAAAEQLSKILSRFCAFEVEISKIRRFRESNYLYLDIATGNSLVHDMHDALNTGAFSDPEQFEFRPHLTLGGPVPQDELEQIHERANETWRGAGDPPRFLLDEIVFVWLPPRFEGGDWRRIWSFSLETKNEPKPEAKTRAASATLTDQTL